MVDKFKKAFGVDCSSKPKVLNKFICDYPEFKNKMNGVNVKIIKRKFLCNPSL